MSDRLAPSVVLALAMFFVPAATHAATAITTCGSTVRDGALTADLDCSASPGWAVTLEAGGSLDLGGHTLTSGSAQPPGGGGGGGVRCLGDCAVTNGSLVSGVAVDWDTSDYPSGVEIQWPLRGRISLSDLSASGYFQVATGFRMDVDSLTATDVWAGVFARTLAIRSSSITIPSPWGYQAAGGQSVEIRDTTLKGGAGVTARIVFVYRSTITGMHDGGIQATGNRRIKRLYVEDSVIDGNCLQPTGEICADLVSTLRMPILVNSTCSTSRRYNRITKEWSSWGICSDD